MNPEDVPTAVVIPDDIYYSATNKPETVRAFTRHDNDALAEDDDHIYFKQSSFEEITDMDWDNEWDDTGFHEYLHLRIPDMHPRVVHTLKGYWVVLKHAFTVGFDNRTATSILRFRRGPMEYWPDYVEVVKAWKNGVNVVEWGAEGSAVNHLGVNRA